MRTKICDGVRELRLVNERPLEVYMVYDGLAGPTLRNVLPDIQQDLEAQGKFGLFVAAIRKRRWANLWVYFHDYVSYGIGGGDTTAEFFFGSLLILHCPATGEEPEQLWLQGHGKSERLWLEERASTT